MRNSKYISRSKTTRMKRVLIISYYWPPTGGSGVQRWVKFCKYLPQLGWQPVVYTPENPEQLAVDESLINEIPEEVEVIKTRILEPYEVYRRLLGRKKQGEINPINSTSGKSLTQKAALWARANLFIPDPRISWVRPSVKYLVKYLEEHPVDVIVTTGPPQSMHLIGRGVKRATGIRWIADFRDPWTRMFYFKHLGLSSWAERRHLRLEKSVLDECDAIISVTPLVQKDFQQMSETPVHMITNGFDESDFPIEAQYSPGDKFTIVHTGLFAVDGNPVKLWDVLAKKCQSDPEFAEKCEIRLAGKIDREIIQSIEERGLGGNLTNLGYLSHNLTVKEQQSASMLILPLRIDPEYRKVLPGKIFEYLASRRPVLGIGQEDGAAATVLKDAAAGEMFDWDNSAQVAEFIEREWQRYKSGDANACASDIHKYTRRALTEELVKIL